MYRKNAAEKIKQDQQKEAAEHGDIDEEEDFDDGESNMAAKACLEAILNIFKSDLTCDSYTNLAPFVCSLLNSAL